MRDVSRASFFKAVDGGVARLNRVLADHRFRLTRWEMVLARVLLGLALWQALPGGTPGFSGQPYPHGLGQWFDFSWVSQSGPFGVALWLSKAGLVMFMLGLLAPLGLCFFLFLDISHHTFFSSQGIQGHGGQLNSLIALALLSGYLWHAIRNRTVAGLLWSHGASEQTALTAARVMLAGTYVVAGLSKIYFGGFDWWQRGESFVLQMLKAQDEMTFTMIRSPLSDSARDVGQKLVENPQFASAMLFCALMMELGAFLACMGRVRGLMLGTGLLLFHLGNEWLMGLPFRGNVTMDLILFIQPVSWLVLLLSLQPWVRKKLQVRNALPWGAPPQTDRPPRRQVVWLLTSPGLVAILLGFFMLWRKEWYPFSNFPMYSILPASADAYYITDLNGQLIPLNKIRLDAPTLKKMINFELRKYKADGRVRRLSDLTDEHRKEAAEIVVTQIQQNWRGHGQTRAFQLHRKDYLAQDGKVVFKTVHIATFAPANAP